MKVEATEVEGRKVYSVRAFNDGVAGYLSKLPTLWIEGEITDLIERQPDEVAQTLRPWLAGRRT